ncbi:hypothetical protein [Citricoccus sp. I39-566]|uniref:hypothetical protein n=1 Tax=Citricoccus sp. I39-566 TaxID=3073268 RepID=UPI00286BE842|nr:hypothetical protein [Citricoccus sp. I39-566]WMY79206.1 hypothetical protein RE421_04905 [Citricoccus sp. I39-566]
MRFPLDSSARLFIGSKPEVREVFGYNDGKREENQSVDIETGLPLWNFDAELIIGEEVESLRVKVAAATAPVLKARTEYRVDGSLLATPYVAQGTGRVAVSVIARGSIVPANAAPARPAAA